MSDRIVFNVRERPVSTDLLNAQAMSQRDALDLVGELAGTMASFSSGLPVRSRRNCVLNGLEVTPSGTSVLVGTGVLLQYSTGLAPTPGTYDSPYRLGALRSPLTVTGPVVGGTTYYLLEAQVSEVTTATESRDILDTGTFAFVPALVPKAVQTTITTQWTAGTSTNFPLPTGGDWVPIAGVRVTGGALAATDLYDFRPMPAMPGSALSSVNGGSTGCMGVSEAAGIQAAPILNGIALSVSAVATTGGIDTTSTKVRDPSNYSASEGYLYLVPMWASQIPGGVAVRGQIVDFVGLTDQRINLSGVLVYSNVPPVTPFGSNGASLALPAPFNAYAPAAGAAICIGAVGAQGLGAFSTFSGRYVHTNKTIASSAAPASPYTFTLTAGTDYPLGAKGLKLAIEVLPSSVTTPAGPWNYSIAVDGVVVTTFACDQSNNIFVPFDAPLLGAAAYGTSSVEVTRSNVGPNVPANYILHLQGYQG